MEYFSSDFHFGHFNIMKYCNRPFSSVQEMDETIINNLNEIILPNDTLFCLGDFSMKNPNGVQSYRDRINCKNIVLIRGNHDPKSNNRPHPALYKAFNGVWDMLQIKRDYNGQPQDIVMCHYAMRTWNKSHYGSISLYGHSHGTLFDDPNLLSMDVGVDCHNFKPITLDQIMEHIKKKRFRPINDHQNKSK